MMPGFFGWDSRDSLVAFVLANPRKLVPKSDDFMQDHLYISISLTHPFVFFQFFSSYSLFLEAVNLLETSPGIFSVLQSWIKLKDSWNCVLN